MRIKCAIVVLVVLVLEPTAASNAAESWFELRRVVDCHRHSVQMESYRSQRMCVSTKVVLDQTNVVDARKFIDSRSDEPALLITIDSAAVENVTRVTSEIEPRLGRVAFIYNGKVLSDPVVYETVSHNQLEINGDEPILDALLADFGFRKPK